MATTTATPAAIPHYKGAALGRSTFQASRSAFAGLLLRDLTVLRKNLKEFLPRTILQPFLLVFVFLYVFPTIGQGIGGGGGAAGESAFATVLVAGVIGPRFPLLGPRVWASAEAYFGQQLWPAFEEGWRGV